MTDVAPHVCAASATHPLRCAFNQLLNVRCHLAAINLQRWHKPTFGDAHCPRLSSKRVFTALKLSRLACGLFQVWEVGIDTGDPGTLGLLCIPWDRYAPPLTPLQQCPCTSRMMACYVPKYSSQVVFLLIVPSVSRIHLPLYCGCYSENCVCTEFGRNCCI